ncbi:MAG: hypothetical protein ACI3V4_10040 [Faecousia sp.]
MAFLKGIPVTLYDKVQTGADEFNAPIYREVPVVVQNVLICPASSEEITGDVQLEGKKAVYELCIPKENKNVWENRVVEFFGQKWKTFGIPLQWIEENIPLDWNRKVKVARYG